MASSVAQTDLRRDKIWLGIIVLVFFLAAGVVFRPIRVIAKQDFTNVYFTYRYERPFGPSERAKQQVVGEVQEKLTEAKLAPDSSITFPSTTDIKLRVPLQQRDEVAETDKKLQKLLDELLAEKHGKRLSNRTDDSGFPDEPLAKVGSLGLFKPKMKMRLGLDIQGGVHLVLKARTQNVEFRFRLADNAASLVKALDDVDRKQPLAAAGAAATAPPAAGDTSGKQKVEAPAAGDTSGKAKAAKPEGKDAAPGDDKAPKGEPAKKADKPAKPDKAEKADKPDKGDKAEKADKGDKAKTAPDGGEPVRIAQADTKDAKDKDAAKNGTGKAGGKDEVEKLTEVEVSPEEAEKLADEALRERVEERIQSLVAALKKDGDLGKRLGEIHAEVMSSNVVLVRTHVDLKAADAETKQKAHAQMLMGKLREAFPATVQVGDAERLKINTQEAMKDVSRIIEQRINGLGVAEASVREQGTDRVLVELPGVKDPDEAVKILGTTARMEFRKVPERYDVRSEDTPDGRRQVTFVLKEGNKPVPSEVVYYEAPAFSGDQNVLVGSDLAPNSTTVTYDQENKPAISLALGRAGSKRFDAFANENQNKELAIFLDRKCIDARNIKERHYGGRVQLTGGFATVRDATNLKLLLDAGALPVPVDVVEQRTVSATLGADSVRQSFRAALLGLLLILVTMVALYRLPGFLATLALIEYAILVLATLVLFDATLTLPGILGFILSVGMAVDGNVIAFERLKELLRERSSRPIMQCIRQSYELSFAAIFDGNVTTMISGAVLFVMGTGPIKGFAVTLFIGTLWSMFSALVVTRKWQNLVAATELGKHRRWYPC